MQNLLIVSLFTLVLSIGDVLANETVSDERISEISQRLESYNTDSLIERRDFLVSYQESDGAAGAAGAADSRGVPAGSKAERAIEISIIDALLVAIGVVILDNITEDSVTPPDTVFPIITILGDNPATVELGSEYNDAGATSDGGETVTVSGTVDTNSVGTYTITYTATDAAGNTSTASRTVNVVDTTAPVITITGDNPAKAELGEAYTDAGATATEASGTISVVTSGTVDTDTLAHTQFYTATDASKYCNCSKNS